MAEAGLVKFAVRDECGSSWLDPCDFRAHGSAAVRIHHFAGDGGGALEPDRQPLGLFAEFSRKFPC